MELTIINYGVLGVGCIALAKYIMYLHKETKEERQKAREEREKLEKQYLEERMIDRKERQETSYTLSKAINNNTNTILGLQILLESFEKKIGK